MRDLPEAATLVVAAETRDLSTSRKHLDGDETPNSRYSASAWL